MLIIVGLGNIGNQYTKTRHNVGFEIVDELYNRHGFNPWRARFNGLLSEGELNGHKTLLVKPQTFMNLSGQCVQAVLQFYKIPVSEIIVIHDELDLKPAEIRLKQGGGDAGHNGLKSISKMLGGTYYRLRVGIGHPRTLNLSIDVSDYVLGKYTQDELNALKHVIEKITLDAENIFIKKNLSI